MVDLENQLELEVCPHCGVDRPNLNVMGLSNYETTWHDGSHVRFWSAYQCGRCGGIVLAYAAQEWGCVEQVFPAATEVDNAIPGKARDFLQQAIRSRSAPAGAVMLAASAIDSMLKEIGYKDGTLNSRIKQAASEHKITDGMAKWAHQIRLDANDQRHADEAATLPKSEDAERLIEFAAALGQFLFVLPAQVTRGLKSASTK